MTRIFDHFTHHHVHVHTLHTGSFWANLVLNLLLIAAARRPWSWSRRTVRAATLRPRGAPGRRPDAERATGPHEGRRRRRHRVRPPRRRVRRRGRGHRRRRPAPGPGLPRPRRVRRAGSVTHRHRGAARPPGAAARLHLGRPIRRRRDRGGEHVQVRLFAGQSRRADGARATGRPAPCCSPRPRGAPDDRVVARRAPLPRLVETTARPASPTHHATLGQRTHLPRRPDQRGVSVSLPPAQPSPRGPRDPAPGRRPVGRRGHRGRRHSR
jgi:hypothetical protein